MTTESQRRDEKLLRQRLPVRLPRDSDIHLRYNKRTDTLTVLLGRQDRWPPKTKVDGEATCHLEEDGTMVRLEFAHASKVFPAEWLGKHARHSTPRRKLGLP